MFRAQESCSHLSQIMTEQDRCVDFAQLWGEEQQLLAELAALVPANGTIVEIGTAQGGSAFIFNRASSPRGVKIYSFDIAPSSEAYANLKNTNVSIIAESSTTGARTWMQTIRRPIDLLFIDGAHTLQHVFEDFNSWVPFLNPGGRIIFHDYDSAERGGLAHLGPRICLDSILRCRLIDQPLHQYRILSGTISHPEKIRLNAEACYRTFANLGQQIVTIRNSDYTGWNIVDNGQFARLAVGCLKADSTAPLVPPDQLTDPNRNYFVSARPLAPVLERLHNLGTPEESIVAVDSLNACYILAHALETNRDYLLSLTSSRNDFMRWEDILFMLNHAFGESLFPDEVPRPSNGADVTYLSHIVAREQVRLAILSNLLKTFVDWTP